LSQGFDSLRDMLAEARRFLGLPRSDAPKRPVPGLPDPRAGSSPPRKRSLAVLPRPICADAASPLLPISRRCAFTPTCFYREHDPAPRQHWPALIAALTDLDGRLTAVQRTCLARDGSDKAPLVSPRRVLGALLGHGVRFGRALRDGAQVMAAGERIETMLSLRSTFPDLPMVAALSARQLAPCCSLPGCAPSISPVMTMPRRGGRQRLSPSGPQQLSFRRCV
jgi:hypothetical protein